MLLSVSMTNPKRHARGWIAPGHALVAIAVVTPSIAGQARLREAIEIQLQPEVSTGLVHVRLRIPSGEVRARNSVTLSFPELGPGEQLAAPLTATRGDRELVVECGGQEGATCRIELGPDPNDVLIVYGVDPTFFPPASDRGNPANARARVTGRLGVIRTTTVLPRIDVEGAPAVLEFRLPGGWTAVTPWRSVEGRIYVPYASLTETEYVGVGPFRVVSMRVGEADVDIAGLSEAEAERVPPILEFVERVTTAPLPSGTRSVLVVPEGFMRGGAAGRSSVVQSPDPFVLAHELLHWWFRADLVAPEGRWFSEGVTQYLAIRAARETGLVPEERLLACLADLQEEMRTLEDPRAWSLARASRQSSADPRQQRLMYSKGALLAYHLEVSFQPGGLGLLLREVFDRPRTGMTNDELRRLFEDALRKEGVGVFDRFVSGDGRLPQHDFGPLGRSGCAGFR